MKLTQTSDFTLKYPWYDVFSTKTMVVALRFFFWYDFLNRFREYKFWEIYQVANLVLVEKKNKKRDYRVKSMFKFIFDKSHCNRVKLNGDAWYTDGWSEEGCLQEGWSTECCIVEKNTVFADFLGKNVKFLYCKIFRFLIFFSKNVFILFVKVQNIARKNFEQFSRNLKKHRFSDFSLFFF